MEVTDQEIFDQAISKEPTQPQEQTENATEKATEAQQTAESERARDEKGRFAKADPEATSEVAKEEATQSEGEKPPKEGWVPSHRLREEREKATQAAEAKYQELQAEIREMRSALFQRMQQPQQQAPQQEPVDIFADPQGFVSQMQKTFEEKVRNIELQNSLRFARQAHGEQFDKAYEAFVDHAHRTRDQAAYAQVMQSVDPGEALVSWFREQEMRRELGGKDLKTFLDEQREAWLRDPANQAKAIEYARNSQSSAPPANPVNLPPSLSKAASAASPHINMGDGTQESIWSQVKPSR